jgi:hypothetical protein
VKTHLVGAEPLRGVIEDSAPPSTYAVAAVLQGQRGAILRTVGLTAARGLAILPGLWITGKVLKIEELKGWKLVGASMAASSCITGFMLLWYYVGSKFTSFSPNGTAQ